MFNKHISPKSLVIAKNASKSRLFSANILQVLVQTAFRGISPITILVRTRVTVNFVSGSNFEKLDDTRFELRVFGPRVFLHVVFPMCPVVAAFALVSHWLRAVILHVEISSPAGFKRLSTGLIHAREFLFASFSKEIFWF